MICALFYTIATVTFIFALFHTTVARTLFINGLTPLLTGVIGWIILREKVATATWVGIAIAADSPVTVARRLLSAGIVTRIDDGRIVCDLRAVAPEDDERLVSGLREALA